MRVASVEPIPASVPYTHTEVSSQVRRDGVTDVLVKITTEDGHVGWGEACSGADALSVARAIEAMASFVVGRDPWNRERMRSDIWAYGLWQFRAGTANFAWAGIDIALWDICARDAGQPLYRLFGGVVHDDISYFFYLSRDDDDGLRGQAAEGLRLGFEVFYLKVGLDDAADEHMVRTVRDALGPGPLLRLDANGAWSMPQALRMMDRLRELDIDFIEQPVRDNPVGHLKELRLRAPIRVAANEGLWSEAQAYERIVARQADIYCFSPYWVGSLAAFHRLSHFAGYEGGLVCKHTHGEFGLAAAASHHLLLTLPNLVTGHQQTSNIMHSDILREPLPIATGPRWGVPQGQGLGVEVDEDAVAEAVARYRVEGQYLPNDPAAVAAGAR